MGLTRYQKAVRILERYMEENKTKIIYTMNLRSLMIQEMGSDEQRVIVPTLKMLREQGVITEVAVNKWEIKI